MIRYSRPFRVQVPISPVSEQILEEHGEGFRGRWSLVETAVLYGRRCGHPPHPDFQPNGIRPEFKTEVDLLRDPLLRWGELGVSPGRLPATIGAVLHRELVDYHLRASRAVRPPVGGPGNVELSARLPAAAFRELRMQAFAGGVDVYTELNRRLTHGIQQAVAAMGDVSGPIVELPVHLPRDSYDRAHVHSRAFGSRVMDLATQQMLIDLNRGEIR